MNLETRMRRLEWANRVLWVGILCLSFYGFRERAMPTAAKTEKLVRTERVEIVDPQGRTALVVGLDDQNATGLYINDPDGSMRVALAHDANGSALFLRDADGVVRVGVAQFSHGGGGVALHGPASQGAAVLYFKEKGTLTFYDPAGEQILRLPQEASE